MNKSFCLNVPNANRVGKFWWSFLCISNYVFFYKNVFYTCVSGLETTFWALSTWSIRDRITACNMAASYHCPIHRLPCVNSLRPRQNGRYNADDTFKCIFLNANVWIPTKILLKFVPKGPINNIPAVVQIMAWRRPGDRPLSELMMVSLLTHICVTRPQWVNSAVIENTHTCSLRGMRSKIILLKSHLTPGQFVIEVWLGFQQHPGKLLTFSLYLNIRTLNKSDVPVHVYGLYSLSLATVLYSSIRTKS